jgi:hypothetical protein
MDFVQFGLEAGASGHCVIPHSAQMALSDNLTHPAKSESGLETFRRIHFTTATIEPNPGCNE